MTKIKISELRKLAENAMISHDDDVYLPPNATFINTKINIPPETVLTMCKAIEVMREALEMGAFHWSGCNANWYEDGTVREGWDGKGEHRKTKPCNCAHYKVDLAISEISELIE